MALLAVWGFHEIPKTRLTIACIVLTLASYSFLAIVSYLEHLRSLRPSSLLCIYLGLSILLDLARTRTLFYIEHIRIIAPLSLAGFFIKLLLFLLEVSEKRRLIRPEWQDGSPEATSGVINRALFLWLNRLFLRGFRTTITLNTLAPLDLDLLSASNPSKLIRAWEKSKVALISSCIP